MKFTVSTKPLSTALDLAVVSNNVSKFYRKSCLAQVTISGRDLIINLEAAQIYSELRFKGAPDSEDIKSTVFVDCLLLKQLVSTFDSSSLTLEITEGGLIITSGKSKFTLPKMIDAAEIQLTSPHVDAYDMSASIDVDKSGWKFVKDYQMYAIAMSYTYPVYTHVWVGENGDVIVGDLNISLFTYSNKSNLGQTCLLSDTIINLFNSLPDGAKMVKGDRSYLLTVKSDGFEYCSEFQPKYEDDESVGSYNSDMILSQMAHPEYNVEVNPNILTKFLSQASLLSTSTEDTIKIKLGNGTLRLEDKNVNCSVDVKGAESHDEVELDFKTSDLQSVLKTFTDDSIHIGPMYNDGEIAAFVFWNNSLTTILGGVE